MVKLYTRVLLTLLIIIANLSSVWSQAMNGTYTVNQLVANSATNFTSFDTLNKALARRGISGPVTVNVATGSGPYTEKVVFPKINGASATNRVRILGNENEINYNTSFNSAVVIFDSASYITFSGFIVKVLNANYGSGIRVGRNSHYDSISNNTIDMNSITLNQDSEAGILVAEGNNYSYWGGDNNSGAIATNNVFYNNTISFNNPRSNDELLGIQILGDLSINNKIIKNTINGAQTGILTQSNNTQISENKIDFKSKSNYNIPSFWEYFYLMGISVTGGVNFTINDNVIKSTGILDKTAPEEMHVWGISLWTNTGSDSITNANVYNNVVYSLKGKIDNFNGISASFCKNTTIAHNTIIIDTLASDTSSSTGIDVYNSSNVKFKNNLVTFGPSINSYFNSAYSVRLENAPIVSDFQGNSAYFNLQTQTNIEYFNVWISQTTQGPFYTPAQLQQQFPGMEANSVITDPLFVNKAIGNLMPQSDKMGQRGTDLRTLVPTDINNVTRPAYPTPGAYQMGPINNIGADSIIASILCGVGTDTLKVRVRNYATNAIDSLTLNWTIDGVPQTPVKVIGNVPVNGTSIFSLGVVNFTGNNVYKVWTSLPNGNPDYVTINDTITRTVRSAMSGTYTVNKNQATGGTNYASFLDLTNDLSLKGVCGPVIVNTVASTGPYNEQVILKYYQGVSGTNTIKINGNNNVIQFNIPSSATYGSILSFDSAAYVTVEGFTIRSLSTNSGNGVLFTNLSQYDTLRNCFVDMTANIIGTSGDNNGIIFSNDKKTPSRNETLACSYSSLIGNKVLSDSTGQNGSWFSLRLYEYTHELLIENNEFINSISSIVSVSGKTNNLIFKNNKLYNTNKVNKANGYFGLSILTSLHSNILVERNTIFNVGINSIVNNNYYGINLISGTYNNAIIRNNIIKNLVGNSSAQIIGIRCDVPGVKIYNNTIDLDATNATNGMEGISNNSTNNEIKNNLISITKGYGRTIYGINNTSYLSASNLQGNNIYIDSTSLASRYPYRYGTTNYTALATLQGAVSGIEATSVWGQNPNFLDPANNDFTVTNAALLANGVDLLPIVSDDIRGVIRPTAPTPGAYQKGSLLDMKADSLLSHVLYCVGNNAVRVRIQNIGLDTVNSVQVGWSLNGVNQTPVNYTSRILPRYIDSTASKVELTLGTANFKAIGDTIRFWIANPNNTNDINLKNDTITQVVYPIMPSILTSKDSICYGSGVQLNIPNIPASALPITWYQGLSVANMSAIGANTDSILSRVNLTAHNYFKATFSLENTCSTDTIAVAVMNPIITTRLRDTSFCGPTSITLAPAVQGANRINWYSNATSATPIATTMSFTTPVLNTTTTYYYDAAFYGTSDTSLKCVSIRDSVTIVIHPAIIVDLGADQSVCSGVTVTLNAGNVGAAYLWSNNATSQSIAVSTPGTYSVQVTNANGCIATDTVVISHYTLPVVDLGTNRSICDGAAVTLSAGNLGSTYLWSNNATSEFITVSAPGTYWVRVTNAGGCVTSDTVQVTNNPLPVVDLGIDRIECIGTSVTFNAGNAGATYLWSNNATTQSIAVTTAGTYWVRVTTAFGCVATDTVAYANYLTPVVDLGADQSVCAGTNITLNAGNAGSTYLWSNNATTQSIAISTPGIYWVQVANANGCVSSDTVVINHYTLPIVDLGADLAICIGSSTILNAGNVGSTYLWSNNATSQSITVATPGTYSVLVTNANGCIAMDTIIITNNALPVVNLGNDTVICADELLVLDAGNPGATYLWSNNATTRTINANSSGAYAVSVTNSFGCVASDTVDLIVHALPIVDLGADLTACIDTNWSVMLNAQNIGASYIWDDASTAPIRQINQNGIYNVSVTSIEGCVKSDTIVINYRLNPILNLSNDTFFCEGGSVRIGDEVYNAASYNWNTGVTTPFINVNTTNNYVLEVTSTQGCTASDSILVEVMARPIVDLGADRNICVDQGHIELVDAMNPGLTYLWDNNYNGRIRTVSASGNYWVNVTDQFGCNTSDTVNVTFKENPIVDLGNDTVICLEQSILLNAGNSGISYYWNTGSNTNTTMTHGDGEFIVFVTGRNGCVKSDTIQITQQGNLPMFEEIWIRNKGKYTFEFNLRNPQNVIGYYWDFGDGSPVEFIQSPVHTYPATGNYTVRVMASSSCGVKDDSITVHIYSLSTNEIEQAVDVSVYPNPNNGYYTVSTEANIQMDNIIIYNAIGQEVKSIKSNSSSEQIDMNNMPSGTYQLKISTKYGDVYKKVIITD